LTKNIGAPPRGRLRGERRQPYRGHGNPNFAVPSIARTLADRGELKALPMKRSYDTGIDIDIHEIFANGFDSERGLTMTEL
jgi:hypothetical protein